MRITEGLMSSRYLRTLNDSLSELSTLNLQMTSGRKYQKASEDPSSALQAYTVRDTLDRLSMYQENISEVKSTFSEAESALDDLNSALTDVQDQVLQGNNGTNESQRSIIANVLKDYQGQILEIANSKFGDQYVFGGNDMSSMPFALDKDGSLLYHGKSVDDASNFQKETYYCDIGLGFQKDVSGNIIPGTAFDIANPGSELMGVGKDSNGISNNLYNLLGDIAQKFQSNDISDLSKYTDKLAKISDENLLHISDIGQKTQMIEALSNRFTQSSDNALIKQKSLEGVDSAKAILDYNNQKSAYNAALAMGAKIIQPTLLDYLR